jgi:hypothetical protein
MAWLRTSKNIHVAGLHFLFPCALKLNSFSLDKMNFIFFIHSTGTNFNSLDRVNVQKQTPQLFEIVLVFLKNIFLFNLFLDNLIC